MRKIGMEWSPTKNAVMSSERQTAMSILGLTASLFLRRLDSVRKNIAATIETFVD